MDGGKAISFRKHSQTFEDLFWAMMQAIKDSPFISHKYSATGFTIRPNVPYIKVSLPTNSSIGGTDGASG
jgi:hypothetical protein